MRTAPWGCPISPVWLLAFGCAVSCWGGKFSALSEAEQERFRRCGEVMRPTLCGADRDRIYSTICLGQQAERYAEQPDEDARMEWLLANACTPSMVNPRGYLPRAHASSGAERPSGTSRPSPVGSDAVLCMTNTGHPYQLAPGLTCDSAGMRRLTSRGTREEAHFVRREVDEFTQHAVLTARLRVGNFGVLLSISPPEESEINFTITSVSPEIRYQRCHNVDALVNGQPFPMPTFEHQSRTNNGVVLEEISARFPPETVLRFGLAPTLRMRVCHDAFEVDGMSRGALLQFLQLLRESAPADAAAPESADVTVGEAHDVPIDASSSVPAMPVPNHHR